jgi:hypothetical protein
MKLQVKFSLYNAVTKIAIILVLGAIILFSLDRLAYNQLDNRLIKKKNKIIENLNDNEIDSLLNKEQSFTDYNILKEEFMRVWFDWETDPYLTDKTPLIKRLMIIPFPSRLGILPDKKACICKKES